MKITIIFKSGASITVEPDTNADSFYNDSNWLNRLKANLFLHSTEGYRIPGTETYVRPINVDCVQFHG